MGAFRIIDAPIYFTEENNGFRKRRFNNVEWSY